MKRILLVIVLMVFFLNSTAYSLGEFHLLGKRPAKDKWCFDYAQVIPPEVEEDINDHGRAMLRHYDVELVVVTVPSLEGGDPSLYAAGLFSRWRIGAATKGKKGMLILLAWDDQQLKFEVGYDLEPYYTDMYVAQVEREMLKEFLEQEDWERGFMATIEELMGRLYRQDLVVEVSQAGTRGDPFEYFSQGAGAQTVFEFGGASDEPLPSTPQELREYFGPQPDPWQAFLRYMETCARDVGDYTLDIFSDDSKIFYSHWRTSSGQRRAEYNDSRNKKYIVREKGKYAVVMAPFNAPVNEFICTCPYFFVKVERGWQVDINTMSRSLIMAGPTWHFISMSHPYMFAFEDFVMRTNRYYPDQGQRAFLGLSYSLHHDGKSNFKIAPEIDSSAEKAGIEDDDLLVSIDGVDITEPYQDWEMMKQYQPGDRVDVVVKRGGKQINIPVTLEAPHSYLDDFPHKRREGDPWTGFYFGYSQPYERDIEDVYLSVIDVVPGSPADLAGFKPRDLIYVVPGSRDSYVTIRDYTQLLKHSRPGDSAQLKVLRDLKQRLELKIQIGSYTAGKEGI